MPEWSSPRPSSAAEQSIPSLASRRILRRADLPAVGIVVPMVASGTTSPACMLNAPHQTWRRSPSPASTNTSWTRSACGMALRLEHLRRDEPRDGRADAGDALDGQAELVHRLGDGVDVVAEGRQLVQPGEEDQHRADLRTAR